MTPPRHAHTHDVYWPEGEPGRPDAARCGAAAKPTPAAVPQLPPALGGGYSHVGAVHVRVLRAITDRYARELERDVLRVLLRCPV